MPDTNEVTALLQAWSKGEKRALEELVPRVQRELQRLARHYMAEERANHPLQTTALINEAYIRLINWKNVEWQSRAHFFAVSAQLMRRILVDAARERDGRLGNKAGFETTFDEAFTYRRHRSHDLLRLDEALKALAELDERKSRVVELRFFGGLSVAETAAVLEISNRTVEREWTLAKAWLYQEVPKH